MTTGEAIVVRIIAEQNYSIVHGLGLHAVIICILVLCFSVNKTAFISPPPSPCSSLIRSNLEDEAGDSDLGEEEREMLALLK